MRIESIARSLSLPSCVHAFLAALSVVSCSVDSRTPSTGTGLGQGTCQAQGGDCGDGGTVTSAMPDGEMGDAAPGPLPSDGCATSGQCQPSSCVDGGDGAGACAARTEGCGDGNPTGSETCDDGNTSNTDACTNACQLPACGDTFLQPGRGETCDDGNRVNSDGCSAACLFGRAPTGGTVAGGHYCMLRSDGATVCWGDNRSGQLGQGESSSGSLGPVVVPNANGIQQLAVGLLGTCGVLGNGNVICWGGNFGAGAASVSGLSDVRQLARTTQTFCALLGSGTVTCFDDVGVITPVLGLDSVRQIAGGHSHICAVRSDDTLLCWGANDSAQLGTGATGDSTTAPAQATQFSDVAEVALGLRHTCVRSVAGGVSCVGNLPGLGLFTNLVPVSVQGWEAASKIVAGSGHLCAILSADTIQCVGPGPAGGISPSDGAPRRILSLPSGIIDVGAGEANTCALLSDSSVFCWGGNTLGQLGAPGPDAPEAVQVPLPAP